MKLTTWLILLGALLLIAPHLHWQLLRAAPRRQRPTNSAGSHAVRSIGEPQRSESPDRALGLDHGSGW
jgi:hypothetical protein